MVFFTSFLILRAFEYFPSSSHSFFFDFLKKKAFFHLLFTKWDAFCHFKRQSITERKEAKNFLGLHLINVLSNTSWVLLPIRHKSQGQVRVRENSKDFIWFALDYCTPVFQIRDSSRANNLTKKAS